MSTRQVKLEFNNVHDHFHAIPYAEHKEKILARKVFRIELIYTLLELVVQFIRTTWNVIADARFIAREKKKEVNR